MSGVGNAVKVEVDGHMSSSYYTGTVMVEMSHCNSVHEMSDVPDHAGSAIEALTAAIVCKDPELLDPFVPAIHAKVNVDKSMTVNVGTGVVLYSRGTSST